MKGHLRNWRPAAHKLATTRAPRIASWDLGPSGAHVNPGTRGTASATSQWSHQGLAKLARGACRRCPRATLQWTAWCRTGLHGIAATGPAVEVRLRELARSLEAPKAGAGSAADTWWRRLDAPRRHAQALQTAAWAHGPTGSPAVHPAALATASATGLWLAGRTKELTVAAWTWHRRARATPRRASAWTASGALGPAGETAAAHAVAGSACATGGSRSSPRSGARPARREQARKSGRATLSHAGSASTASGATGPIGRRALQPAAVDKGGGRAK